MSRHQQKIKDGVARLLEDREQVLAAVNAAPRGSTQQAAGSMQLGSAKRARAHGAAEMVDLRLEAPMAGAITQRRHDPYAGVFTDSRRFESSGAGNNPAAGSVGGSMDPSVATCPR